MHMPNKKMMLQLLLKYDDPQAKQGNKDSLMLLPFEELWLTHSWNIWRIVRIDIDGLGLSCPWNHEDIGLPSTTGAKI